MGNGKNTWKNRGMSLNDNFFGCAETPLWTPNMFQMSSIPVCESCVLRLTAHAAGVGAINQNLEFQESPLTTLSVNGLQYNVLISKLVMPGAHKLGNMRTPYPAELLFYFQSTTQNNKFICLCIPVDIGEDDSNTYFSTLTNDVRKNRPTLAILLEESNSFISYDGVALEYRNENSPRPRDFCDPPRTIITYYVSLSPANMTESDFNRFKQLNKAAGPPKPTTTAITSRITKLCTIVEGIKLDESPVQTDSSGQGGVSTKAMKCFRLDKKNDIVNNRVYVDGKNKPGTRLSDELLKAANGEDSDLMLEKKDASIQPGDVEKALGIILGIIVGLVIASTIAVIIYKYIFKNYLESQKLYAKIPSTADLVLPMPALPGFLSKM